MKIKPVNIYVGTKSATELAENPIVHKRSKRIYVCYDYDRSCVADKMVVIEFVLSDFMMKSLGKNHSVV